MKTLKKFTVLAALAVSALTVSAQVYTFSVPADKQLIPDGEVNGASFMGTVANAGPLGQGFFMSVKLNLQGLDAVNFANNGDYYITLSKIGSDDKAVLVNRPGKPLNAGSGYGDNGMQVTLQDTIAPFSATAANDIHTYKSVSGYADFQSPLTGVWAPDGRSADPSNVTSAGPRDRMLSVFNGQNPNGDWALFVADMSSGGQGKLTEWGLEFTAVPEPQQYALIAGLALIGFALYRRYAVKMA